MLAGRELLRSTSSSRTDGGPFVPFETATTDTSATFNGAVGHTYGFYSVATDNVGNREATPASAQASTTL